MDIEQEEMKFLGFFGIYKEAYKLIFRWRKIFSQITLTLSIIQLPFIFLAHEELSEIFYWRIGYTEFKLHHHTKAWTTKYFKLSDLIPFDSNLNISFRIDYFIFVLVFSLLSTSTVVYTVACVYTSCEITFMKVMSVAPFVFKRLMVTFLCVFFAFCAYIISFALTLSLWGATIADSKLGMVVLLIILTLYALGFVYMSIIWQVASVVSVLEESYGFKAMIKSKGLIKGKMVLATAIFLKMKFSLAIINLVFGFRALYLMLLLILILSELVIQTVLYLVCKSYHHENIDKSALSDHFEVYLGRLRMFRWRIVMSKFVFILVTTFTKVMFFLLLVFLGGSEINKKLVP